jgi:hypothetical protein
VSTINSDYTEFVQLSTELASVNDKVKILQAPLKDVHSKVESIQLSGREIVDSFNAKLAEQKALCEKREKLQLCVKVQDLLHSLEGMLGVEVHHAAHTDSRAGRGDAATEDVYTRTFGLSSDTRALLATETSGAGRDSGGDDKNDSTAVESSMLERAARGCASLTHQQLYGSELLFVQRLTGRITRVEQEVRRRLEATFAEEVVPDSLYSRQHTVNSKAVGHCLRGFVALDGGNDAGIVLPLHET